MTTKFNIVATGGTFDEIHIGHIALLSKAFEVGKKVIIGVSSDEFAVRVKGKDKLTHNYEERITRLQEIIEKKFRGLVYEISKLDTDYGPTVVFGEVEALVASAETAKKGQEINKIRSKNGIRPLTIITVDMIRAEDGNPISSTRIRAGEIDTNGKLLKAG